MKSRYHLVLLLTLLVGLGSASTALAQDGVLVVEWADQDGNVINNALRDAIANDTERPENRVYKLKRGGFYWNEDRIQFEGYHLRIVGETADEANPAEAFLCGVGGDEDCGPAIIQRTRRADQSIDGVMIQNTGTGSHLTVQNVWLLGQDSDGVRSSYEQIQLDAADSHFTFDNVVFDRNDWHFLGPNAENVDMTVTNSTFRNLFGPSQQWEGLGVRFEAGADSVIFDNNTFLNIGFTPFQSEAAPMNYFRANHNTFVNIGRSFQAGALWKEAYITNNVFVNYFWHGEQPSEYEDPDREDPFTGFFGIAAMPARFGTDLDRRIVVANNSFWRDSQFASLMPSDIRSQPVVNDTTAGWFETFDGMVMQDNLLDLSPDLVTYPADLIPSMVSNITELRAGNSASPRYDYDPGRDETCFQCNIWPRPEDFSYTTADLLTAGTDDLPLGDLNWFTDAKATYETNRATYVQAIEDLAGGRIELIVVGTGEADQGTLGEGATVAAAEGFTYYEMDSSGFIEWSFDLATEGTYDLSVGTHLRGNGQRGQRIFVNGTNLRNNAGFGEYYWDVATGVPSDDWFDTRIDVAGLIEGAAGLTMPAGANTIRIEPSWGFQRFSDVSIIDPTSGDTLLVLSAPDAVAEGVRPVCDAADFCPTGFKSVAMGAGATVALNFDFPGDGKYVARIFFNAPAGGSADLQLDGNPLFEGLTFTAEGTDIITPQFDGTAGVGTLTLVTEMGGFNVDFIQLISVAGVGTSTERDELPDGFALEQNYPNPFNPSTTISYTLGASGNVQLVVYDVLGRQVQTLANTNLPAGSYQVIWDGRSATGQQVTSGVYFYQMETEVGTTTRRMVFLK
ncbi:MAG: T9SS type A sorting domain-containing protein [Rhodothermales bacterium]|nr:T9SS type A sorting domain-containing protein [Rhodothermales bacterium]